MTDRKHFDRRALLKVATTVATAAPLAALPAFAGGTGDDALIAAEIKIAAKFAWLAATRDARTALDAAGGNSDTMTQPVFDEINALDDFIADTPAASLAGAAVKLRRVLDVDDGIITGVSFRDIPSLVSVLDLIHGIIGQPTHPTRPTCTGHEGEEDDA